MKIGRTSGSVYRRSVAGQWNRDGSDKGYGAGMGDDCAILSSGALRRRDCGSAQVCRGEEELVYSLCTVDFGGEDAGKLAVAGAVNRLAAGPALPMEVGLSLTLPEGAEEGRLRELAGRAKAYAGAGGLAVGGIHSRVSGAVLKPVATAVGIGRKLPETGGEERKPADGDGGREKARPGQDLVLTKWIGLEGTSVLARMRGEELLARYPAELVGAAASFDGYLSVAAEAAAALKSGVRVMHDVSEGGLFGALWEFAEEAGVGLEIGLKSIPIRQETVEVSEFFGLNPYRLHSGGSLLLAADNGGALVQALRGEAIQAVVIGKVTGGNDRVIIRGEERRFLEAEQPDELYRAGEPV